MQHAKNEAQNRVKHDLQAARKAALGSQSPRARGAEKEQRSLRWIYRWGWSTPSIIDEVADHSAGGYARRLASKGLVQIQETGSGGAKNHPARVVGLTRAGRAQVESSIENPNDLRDYHGLRRVRWQQLLHDAMVQSAVLRAIQSGRFSDYLTPHEIAEKQTLGRKEPDAVLTEKESGYTYAVELELSAKTGRRLDEFVHGLSVLLHPESGDYDHAIIGTTSPAISARYRARFREGEKMPIWKRDERGRPYLAATDVMPAWIEKKIIWNEVSL